MSTGSYEFKVPKESIPVDIALEGFEPFDGRMSLSEYRPHGFNHEDVLDVLEDTASGRMLPVFDTTAGSWTVVSKARIRWIGINDPRALDKAGETLYEHQRRVVLTILGGDRLEGDLLYMAPASHQRVQDYLNQTGGFFPLWGSDRLYIVNHAHVVRVDEPTQDAAPSGGE